MKDISVAVCNQLIEEFDVARSAMVGGTIGGALSAIGGILRYRQLVKDAKKRLSKCGKDHACIKDAKEELAAIRKYAAIRGIGDTVRSAATSVGLSAGVTAGGNLLGV